jgi:hypothetical protein
MRLKGVKDMFINVTHKSSGAIVLVAGLCIGFLATKANRVSAQSSSADPVADDAMTMLQSGRQIFRFDTFGDEDFWGGQLNLHQAIAGSKGGGVGAGLSPAGALKLGLKVDAEAVPQSLATQIKAGQVDLNDPANTLALLKLNAVVGVTGVFSPDGSLKSMGIQCAICHSTVDNSFMPGIGKRLDGWPNRDLNVGAIIALAPSLRPMAELLQTDQDTVRKVLMSWGPGKFDAELFLDGKAFNPITGSSAATLIPPAFGLAGVNLHTWTGWGNVSHWNAFVANIEMHGKGRFSDSRLNAGRFPIAVRGGFANIQIDPDSDQITKKLPALQFYQLALRSPKPPEGSFDKNAADRGDKLFSGKAQCNNCHVEPLWTEPGWNMHAPRDVCIDSFQADRAPDRAYRTSPLGGLFAHQKGGFYHDGRFATLMDVMNHYNTCMNLGLSDGEKSDVIQYLLSL